MDLVKTTNDLRHYNFDSYTSVYDMMWDINPEIAANMYADKQNLLTYKNIPYFTKLREFQRDEKIALYKILSEKYRTDSSERIAFKKYDTDFDITKLMESELSSRTKMNLEAMLTGDQIRENGLNYRTEIIEKSDLKKTELLLSNMYKKISLQETGATTRESIKYNLLLKMKSLEVETNLKTIQLIEKGKLYLEDRKVEALIEARNRHYDTALICATLDAESKKLISNNKLKGLIELSRNETCASLKKEQMLWQGKIEIEKINAQMNISNKLFEVYIRNRELATQIICKKLDSDTKLAEIIGDVMKNTDVTDFEIRRTSRGMRGIIRKKDEKDDKK